MRGRSEHFVVKVYIRERKHFIPQVWRKISGEKNTNKCNYRASHDFCGDDTFCFGAKPQEAQDTMQFAVVPGLDSQGERGGSGDEEMEIQQHRSQGPLSYWERGCITCGSF